MLRLYVILSILFSLNVYSVTCNFVDQSRSLAEHLSTPIGTVDEAIDMQMYLSDCFNKEATELSFFPLAYYHTTNKIKSWLNQNKFSNANVVSEQVVSFTNAYMDALYNNFFGKWNKIPAPWQRAFSAAKDRKKETYVHLLLGMNAHILWDLPISLVSVGYPNYEENKADFFAMNKMFWELLPTIESAVAYRAESNGFPYFYNIDFFNRTLMPFLKIMRRRAWKSGDLLKRSKYRGMRRLSIQTKVVGNLIELGNYDSIISLGNW